MNYRMCKYCKHFGMQKGLQYCLKRNKPIFWNDFLCKTFERKINMNEREIITSAIRVFGEIAQEEVAIEECSELIQAITHKHRGREHNIAEEIADVEIMCEQLKIINNCADKVEEYRKAKIERLYNKVFDACL